MARLETSTKRTVERGRFYPLGPTLEPNGVNFALYSKHGSEVYLASSIVRTASPPTSSGSRSARASSSMRSCAA